MRSLLPLLVLGALSTYVLADQILPAHVGGSFSRSSREPKYKMEFHPEEAPFHPDEDQESVVMPDTNGRSYICYLPKIEKAKSEKPVNQVNITSMIVETERRLKLKTPDELLEVFKGKCLVRVSICFPSSNEISFLHFLYALLLMLYYPCSKRVGGLMNSATNKS
ncbi:unnamed protein product [Linum tenue]|uniref:Uncharacterized protein n=1 Tax=Linum tenue TaxID=586396 RepID=A0AAV0QE22_9ROSI|nr:unnamed protein product [Linum tenue]